MSLAAAGAIVARRPTLVGLPSPERPCGYTRGVSPTFNDVQLTRDNVTVNVIRAWERGRVRVADRWLDGHVIVAPDRVIESWDVDSPSTLEVEHLEPAIALAPEIILLGTGTELLLPDVDLMAALAERSIGLEVMSTPAACRTFNVLIGEQRRVVVALFNFADAPSGPG
jgi:uncharacterized protein